jgi:tetratricopeptide (TPR) repeat protein
MRRGLVPLTCALLLATLAIGASGAPVKHRAPAGRASAAPESLRVLARVGRETITPADVNRRLEEIPDQVRTSYNTPEGRQQLLDRLIEEHVWMQMAARKGIGGRPDVRRQLESARRDLLIRTYLNEVMANNATPGDSEAKSYYDAHLQDYKMPATVSLRHIQSKSEADARRMLGYARSGQDFAKLAQKYSSDTLTRASGGMLGTITHDGMFGSLGAQPALAESAFKIVEGKVGGPYKTSKGWSVLKVDSKHDESVRSFDQVRPTILRQLGSQRSQEFYRQRLDEARRSIGVTADSAAIKSYLSAKKSARDLFKDAQEGGAPTERIAKYQQLLKEYPDSDVSPQAQFMIGFIYSEELRNYDQAEQAFHQVLSRYPKSELAPSAKWMVEHMRSEDAPAFLNLEADSSHTAPAPKKGSNVKP